MNTVMPTLGLAKMRRISPLFMFDTVDVYKPPDPNTAARDANGEINNAFPSGWTKVVSSGTALFSVSKRTRSTENQGAGQAMTEVYYDIELDFNTALLTDETCRLIVTAAKFSQDLVGAVFDIRIDPSVSMATLNSFQGFRRL